MKVGLLSMKVGFAVFSEGDGVHSAQEAVRHKPALQGVSFGKRIAELSSAATGTFSETCLEAT